MLTWVRGVREKLACRVRKFAAGEQEGANLVEYALLVAFIAAVVLAGVTAFGNQLLAYFNQLQAWVSGWTPVGAGS